MTRTRAVTLTALVAASAMVFAACSGSPGQTTTTSSTSSATSSASSASTPAGSSSSGVPGSTGAPSSGAPTSGTGGSTQDPSTYGCGAPHGPYTQPAAQAGTVATGSAELATSWNSVASHDASVYNVYPNYFTQAQLWYYDKDLKLVNNDSFATCVVTSKSPLTVKYTIKPGVKWSDGVPVDATDFLLAWMAQSGKYSTGAPKIDPKTGIPIPGANVVAFDSAIPGVALITAFPTISADKTSISFVYSQPFTDYQLNLVPGVPAHVTAMKALGITDPIKAEDALIAAAKTDDKAKLAKISSFWNTGFDFTTLPSDKSLYLSNGAYMLTDFKANQYMTFTANPDYTWGPKPSIKTITYTYQPDPTAAVQAMSNGELQIIEPEHPTVDLLKGLKALSANGITATSTVNGGYEHVDLVFNNGGPFDPKTYGGDATKAQDVRLAFLKTVPRDAIVDRLIKPLLPTAVPRDSFTQVPGTPGYAAISKSNGMAAYDKPDIAGAKALLAKAGLTSVSVRLLYSATSATRASEYQLMAASAKLAGITLVDGKDPDWSTNLTNNKKYDASLFGWSNPTLAVSANAALFSGYDAKGNLLGQSNYGGYNNAAVTKDMDTLNITPDPAKQQALLSDTDNKLVADGFGTILYQDPDIVGFDSSKVTNVTTIALLPGVFYDYWNWKIPGS